MPTPEEKRKRHADYMREYARRTGYQKAAYSDPEKLAKQRAKWRAANARWRAKNPERHRAFAKRYADNNKEQVLAKKREYHRVNAKALHQKKRIYISKNREAVRARARAYMARRSETDLNFRIKGVLRSRIQIALRRRGLRKCKKTEDLIGCSVDFLRGYIEARFKPGMTWENYGTWHADHRIPLAEFDLRDLAQQKQAFNYTDLQPLWSLENMSKGSRLPPTHQAELI